MKTFKFETDDYYDIVELVDMLPPMMVKSFSFENTGNKKADNWEVVITSDVMNFSQLDDYLQSIFTEKADISMLSTLREV